MPELVLAYVERRVLPISFGKWITALSDNHHAMNTPINLFDKFS